MAVTVVIPAYNRYSRLLETLQALGRQDYKDFSVIVVDDGSVEPEYNHAHDLEKSFSYPLQVIRQKNAGASAATNNGVQHAADGLIILFDNDIIPSADCISRHVAFHEKNPGSILSGSADTDINRSTTDVQRYKLHMEETWRKLRPDTEKLLRVDFDNFIITTANMSMNRSVHLGLNGFDVQLRDGYDVDFGFRALLNKIPLYFDRTIKTIHNDQISLRYYASRQRAYTESKRKIAEQHPELRSRLEHETAQLSAIKRFIYSLLRSPMLVRFFESGFFAAVFPRSFRYRIYGSTIAALST